MKETSQLDVLLLTWSVCYVVLQQAEAMANGPARLFELAAQQEPGSTDKFMCWGGSSSKQMNRQSLIDHML